MGRDCWSSRLMVEQCRALNVESMKRDGVFATPSGSCWTSLWLDVYGNREASLEYRVDQSEGLWLQLAREMQEGSLRIELSGEKCIRITSTRPHFGGTRYWFVCECGRRVGRLYLPPGKQNFACRHCHYLIRKSARQHDARVYRLARDPAAWNAALDDRKLTRRLLGMSAFTLWFQREREGKS